MAWYRRVLVAFLLCCGVIGSAWASGLLPSWGNSDPQFLDAADVFKLEAAQRQGEAFLAAGHIADGYYVYRHSIKLVDARGREVGLNLPAGQPKHDEFFGDTEIYTVDDLRLVWPATIHGPLTLHWQGCAEAGICYPPQKMPVALPPQRDAPVSPASSTSIPPEADAAVQQPALPPANDSAALPLASVPDAAPPATPLSSPAGAGAAVDMAEDQAAAQKLATLGPVAGTLLFFGFGLLLAFTPCTLPMIPIVSTLVVGSQANPRRALLLSLSYVLAMAGTYAAVGVAAGLAGANLQATLQSPWLLGAFAALFLILASSLFGLFELRLPSALVNRVDSASKGHTGGRIAGAAALGFLSALLVGPCMTAPLAGALLYIGQTGSALYGGLALFALGLGMGLPLLAIAVFGARVLPRPGAWMEMVRVAFGYVMVGMAVMMLSRFLPGTASLLLWGMWILSIAIGLIAWGQAVATRHRLAWTLRSGAAFAGLWSVLMLVGAASGGESTLQPLAHLRGAATAPATIGMTYVQAKSTADVDARIAEAGARGQWTLIDFYADWCVSCHVIERNVFGNPAVAARLANVQIVRPDVTRNDEEDQALLKRWQVQGPPTMILIGPDGEERRAQRVVGEINADGFLGRLDSAGAP
ncbi:MAG: thiol:disulfide interchange protein [Thiobacillus sp. 63-78]|nr:protein-disulfide reductase DsbD [Thiobacillus sp.]OJZ13821.1 MAG: thiol:disulfide interchange protein [Thiobacillus sp. 63-78]